LTNVDFAVFADDLVKISAAAIFAEIFIQPVRNHENGCIRPK